MRTGHERKSQSCNRSCARNAEDQCRNAVIREEFNPTKYADQLAAIPGAEGVRHEMLQAGIEFFQRYKKEVADDPSLATDWALAQSKLGTLNEKLDNKKDAIAAHTKAMEVWQERLARDPSNVENARNLALAGNNLGMILQQV